MQSIHFIGIGGVGMSALAQSFIDRGWHVSGSDRLLGLGRFAPVLDTLRQQGVQLFPQDGSAISAQTGTVVYSTAIEQDNPDFVRAKSLGLNLCHRSEVLAKLSEGHTLIAVTGTCGKSSVTALLGHLLTVCGADPCIINGAEMTGYDADGTRVGSVRTSSDPKGWMVVEADESDKSLMVLSPAHIIITNASGDHFPKEEAICLFDAFKSKASGVVIDSREEPPETFSPDGLWESVFQWRGRSWMLPMPGAHNIANAKAALSMALALGFDAEKLNHALATFRGIRRRLERVGTCHGAMVVDDYAHNIEKLSAAWTTLSAVCPQGVYGVWRPHGYAPLRKMLEGLVAMFNATVRPCDKLFLLPVYDDGGTADRSINSEVLFSRLTCPVEQVADLSVAEERLRAVARPGTMLALFGARDHGLSALATRLVKDA
ncbi:MAG: Mur ligase domain-containing protein [Kiritimatiellia bacterium]